MDEINKSKIWIFYDGTCGLCHKFVVFVLRNMKEEVFIFSPQSGHSFKEINDSEKYLGQSIVAYIENENQLFSKGDAVRLVLSHLRWPWRGLAYFLRCFPSPVLDFFYDCVAKIRHRFFKQPDRACPIVPARWSKFFKD
ncbi:MAG TPA: DCC1-like thiol-disulfide oxidoreductase family protein [Chlamydiales bacterium]|nr:DCC1-like thiol-disulfide oxidoreductase family protein [Chlamydiales bacterium]